MTAAEMIKKINTYNEVAQAIGEQPLNLTFYIPFGVKIENIKSKAQFVRILKRELIDELVEAVLNCKDYEFNEEVTLHATDKYGWEFTEKVEFYLA